MKIKKGDKVKVISGKDKGKIGEVVKVIVNDNKLLVTGINLVKKHTKPSKISDGGVITKELPIHASNVAYYHTEKESISKLGRRFKDNKKVRFLKLNNDQLSN